MWGVEQLQQPVKVVCAGSGLIQNVRQRAAYSVFGAASEIGLWCVECYLYSEAVILVAATRS
jgi:hypothetical protein